MNVIDNSHLVSVSRLETSDSVRLAVIDYPPMLADVCAEDEEDWEEVAVPSKICRQKHAKEPYSM